MFLLQTQIIQHSARSLEKCIWSKVYWFEILNICEMCIAQLFAVVAVRPELERCFENRGMRFGAEQGDEEGS